MRTALAAGRIAAAVCAAGGSARADAYDATLTRAIAAKERAMDVNEPARWEEALRLFQEADAIRATREASYELGHAAERLAHRSRRRGLRGGAEPRPDRTAAQQGRGLRRRPRRRAGPRPNQGRVRRPRPQRRYRARSPAAAPPAGPVPRRNHHRNHRQPGPPHPPPPQADRRPTRNPRSHHPPVLVPAAVSVPAAAVPPHHPLPPPSPPPTPAPSPPPAPAEPSPPSIDRPPAGGSSAPASRSRRAAA